MKFASSTPFPNSLSQVLQAAAEAWKQRDYQKGINILQRANQLEPTEPRILFQLGVCHGLCYDFTEAERCFEKAVNIAAKKPEAFLAAGLQCLNLGRPEMAEPYFERALKQNGNSVEALTRLAEIRERQNRPKEAEELTSRALNLNPYFLPALLIRARLQRSAGKLEDAEALLRSCIDQPNPNTWLRAQAWYELGNTLDGLKRFDDAMTAFLHAKSLVPETAEQKTSRQAAQADLKKTTDSISGELLRRWQQTGETLRPNRKLAFLCSHPRSGTTLLEQILDSHPDVLSIEETSIFFEESFMPLGGGSNSYAHYVPVLDSTMPALLQQSRKNYFRCAENLLGQPIGERLLIDKNPSLTSLIPAIIRVFPEIKFLIALRDPRDVCISCFAQPIFPKHRISSVYPTIAATVEDYCLLMNLWQNLKAVMPVPFLEVRYEDLVDNLESVARRTLEFLEVPWNNRVLEFQKHTQNKLVHSPTYAEVRKPVSKRAVGRWRNYQKYLEPYLPMLEPFVKAFGYE